MKHFGVLLGVVVLIGFGFAMSGCSRNEPETGQSSAPAPEENGGGGAVIEFIDEDTDENREKMKKALAGGGAVFEIPEDGDENSSAGPGITATQKQPEKDSKSDDKVSK